MRRQLAPVLVSLALVACSTAPKAPQSDFDHAQADTYVPFADPSANERTPAQFGGVDPATTMRFTPFFIEAYPPNIDPRTGDLSRLSSPVSTQALQQALLESFAPLMADLAGTAFIGSRPLDELVMIASQKVWASLGRTFTKLESQLPDTPSDYTLVLLPWQFDEQNFYAPSGVQLAGLPQTNGGFGRPADFFRKVERNFRGLQTSAIRFTPSASAYFLGAIVNVRLQKGASQAATQILLGLNGREVPFSQANEQVSFTHLVVPGTMNPRDATVASITTVYDLASNASPSAKVELGPMRGWSSRVGRLGIMLENDPRRLCQRRTGSAPYLKGALGPVNPLGAAGAGLPVDFRIYDFTLNLTTTRVSEMNLGIGAGFNIGAWRAIAGCFDVPSVEEQFRSEANKAIEAQVAGMQQRDPARILRALLNKAPGGRQ